MKDIFLLSEELLCLEHNEIMSWDIRHVQKMNSHNFMPLSTPIVMYHLHDFEVTGLTLKAVQCFNA